MVQLISPEDRGLFRVPDRYRGGHLFISGAPVQGSDSLFDLRVSDHKETPSLHISAARRAYTCLKDLPDQFVRHRVGFQSPHRACGFDDLEQVSGVVFVRHGVLAGVRLGQPRLSDRPSWCKDRLRR